MAPSRFAKIASLVDDLSGRVHHGAIGRHFQGANQIDFDAGAFFGQVLLDEVDGFVNHVGLHQQQLARPHRAKRRFDRFNRAINLWSPDSKRIVFPISYYNGANLIVESEATGSLYPRSLGPGTMAVWSPK